MERHIAQIFQMSQTAASPTGLRGHLVLFRAGTERKLELDCVEITIKIPAMERKLKRPTAFRRSHA